MWKVFHECIEVLKLIATSLFLINLNDIIILHFQLEQQYRNSLLAYHLTHQLSALDTTYLFRGFIIINSPSIKQKPQRSNWHTLNTKKIFINK